MKLTPTDVQRQAFGKRFRGFDPDEVRAFLAAVADEMAALQRAKDEVDQQLRHLEVVEPDFETGIIDLDRMSALADPA